ncbi:MAG: tRNA (N(6)-L-threonylcarbamoyladenosine(37)-C(2))-methylthiotransferase MtaB [Anaerolineaceae bacterium]|nr:tRNA (N(6)-L-threonylcarbamoyladenosine(37)-C(2))-methylthiotransferase MtaB [Anaerolineaceae bacterium]
MKVHLRTLGCRLNQSEIDTMARQLQQQGHEVVDDPAQADQFIVNTCAVTNEATASSRKLIRELGRANETAEITVTGCYAQISPQAIRVLPNVGRVVDNLEKDRLVEHVTGVPLESFDQEPFSRDDSLPGAMGRTRAFVKVQDGCDNACTFCITTVARGAGRSRSMAEVVEEIRYLYDVGYHEVVLTGVHLGSYGHDLNDPDGLVKLVHAILAETDIPRLRLSSLEPWDLSPSFFDLWQNPRVCRHLHLPLQSGCDATLKRMLRRTNQVQFRALVQAARERVPGISITTDMIVGFPGETDEEFAISEAFVREMAFAGLHVFRYSKRPGTAATRMRGHVSEATKKVRSNHLRALSEQLEGDYAGRFTGETLDVLWEQVTGATEDGFVNVGYTDNYIKVRAVHPRALSNTITPARLEDYARQMANAVPIIA